MTDDRRCHDKEYHKTDAFFVFFNHKTDAL